MYLVSSSDSAAAGVVGEEVDEEAIYIVSRVFLYSRFSRFRGRLVNSAPFRSTRVISVLQPGSQRLLRYARVSR
jgi:hypothetical protein